MSDVPNFEEIIKSIKPAPALPVPEGKVVRVDSPMGIIRAIEDADEGSTILIAKGHYMMPRDCMLMTHCVTIRGETGNREDVILDCGMDDLNDSNPIYSTRIGASAIIKITQARGVTIADLTLANNPKYGILFFGDGRVQDLTVYNVKFHNIWARGLKGTGAARLDDKECLDLDLDLKDPERLEWVRPRNIQVRHCLWVIDRVKQNIDDFAQGNYIAGMDVMNVANYTVSDCTFIGIRGRTGGGRGSIFIWQHCDDVTIENNHFYHCDKGISLGNPSGKEGKAYHIRNSVIRNNTIIGGSNKAIEVDFGNNINIVNNTIESEIRKDFAAIQVIDIKETSLVEGNTIRLHGEEPFNCDDTVTIGDNNLESAVSQ